MTYSSASRGKLGRSDVPAEIVVDALDPATMDLWRTVAKIANALDDQHMRWCLVGPDGRPVRDGSGPDQPAPTGGPASGCHPAARTDDRSPLGVRQPDQDRAQVA